MKTIWKYNIERRLTVNLPCGAKILTVAAQGKEICIWAEVDPHEAELVSRSFEVFGTGHEIKGGDREYLGTVFIEGLVFHVYERLSTTET